MVYDISSIFISSIPFDMKNKLLCSFTAQNRLLDTIAGITSRYAILYDKMFVLESPQTTEYIITYNIDTENSVKYIQNISKKRRGRGPRSGRIPTITPLPLGVLL